jgi:tRNA-dihydrouridine synthase B
MAPMDGYTDCAFRDVVKKYGKPDLMFTEFVNCQGLMVATDRLIEILRYTENQRPIIAQLFGHEVEFFYNAALLVCELGFDGVDINMGCPARDIASRGSGAGLIKTPDLALQIIQTVKRAVADYQSGKTFPLYQDVKNKKLKLWRIKVQKKREITVSVKTRIGYDKDSTSEWIKTLISAKPDFISLHARTFKQGYKGKASWEAIENAVTVSTVPLIGNGDVGSFSDIQKMFKQTHCAGVMIGRAAVGKPWVFQKQIEKYSSFSEVKKIALEQVKNYVLYKGEKKFYEMRKQLLAYFKGFERSKYLRIKLSHVSSAQDVLSILK